VVVDSTSIIDFSPGNGPNPAVASEVTANSTDAEPAVAAIDPAVPSAALAVLLGGARRERRQERERLPQQMTR